MKPFDLTIPLEASDSGSVTLVVPRLACRDESGNPSNCWKGPHMNMEDGQGKENMPCLEQRMSENCKWRKIADEKTVRKVVKDASLHLCLLAAKMAGMDQIKCDVFFDFDPSKPKPELLAHHDGTMEQMQKAVGRKYECFPTVDMALLGRSESDLGELMGMSDDREENREWSLVHASSIRKQGKPVTWRRPF